MFAVVVSGRPVLGTFHTISPTQVAFSIPSSPAFNHLVVFLLPDTVLPPGHAAAVYIQLTPASDFQLLGALTPAKPSAIYRTRNVGASASAAGAAAGVGELLDEDAMMDADAASAADITLGISLEPMAQVEQALAALKAPRTGLELVKRAAAPTAGSPVPTKVLASRIIANAFNFLASFGGDTIPLKSFEEWWKKFERKVDADPSFLERGDGI